jgi:glycosyltransferase involved in cell wall biosynthesis
VDGLLVPALDPAAWAAAIERLLAEPGLGVRLGESARHRARETFALEHTVRRTLDLYHTLAGSARL